MKTTILTRCFEITVIHRTAAEAVRKPKENTWSHSISFLYWLGILHLTYHFLITFSVILEFTITVKFHLVVQIARGRNCSGGGRRSGTVTRVGHCRAFSDALGLMSQRSQLICLFPKWQLGLSRLSLSAGCRVITSWHTPTCVWQTRPQCFLLEDFFLLFAGCRPSACSVWLRN